MPRPNHTPGAGLRRAYEVAFGLSVFTIVYNLAEGAVSTWLGLRDETLALLASAWTALLK